MGKLTPRVQHPDIFACFQHMLVFSLLIFFMEPGSLQSYRPLKWWIWSGQLSENIWFDRVTELTGKLSDKQGWTKGRTVWFPIRAGKDIFSFYCRSQTYWNRTPGENPISVKHIQSLLSFCFIAQYIFYHIWIANLVVLKLTQWPVFYIYHICAIFHLYNFRVKIGSGTLDPSAR